MQTYQQNEKDEHTDSIHDVEVIAESYQNYSVHLIQNHPYLEYVVIIVFEF